VPEGFIAVFGPVSQGRIQSLDEPEQHQSTAAFSRGFAKNQTGAGRRTLPGLFNALYMNLIDCSAAMPPIARLYRVLATFSARLKRRMLAANERILAKTPGFLRIREASSAKLPSRT